MGRQRGRVVLDDETWLDEVWQAALDLVQREDMQLHITMRPTTRRGVFVITVAVVWHVEGSPRGVAFKESSAFPNSQASTLTAFLYQQVTALLLRYEEARKTEIGI